MNQSKSTNQIIQIERNDHLIAIFLKHKHQQIELFDNESNHSINYELNPKLFAINEPFLMKTERDALIKLKKLESESNDSKVNNGSIRKRKKSLVNKLHLLQSNFESDEEKLMITNLIDKYLNQSNVNNDDPSNLMNSIQLNRLNSNDEAQTFVNSLFLNRFESLNYRTKLLCNPFLKTIKAKFGLSNFLIPPHCSFAGIDVIDGIKMLIRHLKPAAIGSSAATAPASIKSSSLICTKNPFVIIMDPAWDNNKSVKRKRAYETVSMDYVRRFCNETKTLINLIDDLRRLSIHKQTMSTTASIICAIWTTNLDKEFVINEMLPLLDLKLTFILKWHKITNIGLPVKVHGGQEYLILAIKTPSVDSNVKNGTIVSIPSAIHSHKPNIMPVIKRLFHFDQHERSEDLLLHCCMLKNLNAMNRDYDQNEQRSLGKNNSLNQDNYWLIANEFINYICGVELFARYLQTGFHSIGYECIKLQNENLFVQNNHCSSDLVDIIL